MLIKNENGEYIEFIVLNYFEDSCDYELSVKAHAAFITLDFQTYAQARKLRELLYELCKRQDIRFHDTDRKHKRRTLQSNDLKIDNFDSENSFAMNFSYDISGHINVKCRFDCIDGENACTISFVTDRTFIDPFTAALKKAIDRHG